MAISVLESQRERQYFDIIPSHRQKEWMFDRVSPETEGAEMELRVLRYFLAVAREGNVTRAAERLFVTQPTLSKQLMDLEAELGCRLFERGGRRITLTGEGLFLRRRAEEIVGLADRARAELIGFGGDLAGEVSIGGGETEAMRLLGRAAKALLARHPRLTFNFHSGNAEDVKERLDRGLLDFGLVIEPTDLSRHDFLRLPAWEPGASWCGPTTPSPGDPSSRPAIFWGFRFSAHASNPWAMCSPAGSVRTSRASVSSPPTTLSTTPPSWWRKASVARLPSIIWSTSPAPVRFVSSRCFRPFGWASCLPGSKGAPTPVPPLPTLVVCGGKSARRPTFVRPLRNPAAKGPAGPDGEHDSPCHGGGPLVINYAYESDSWHCL